MTSSPDLYGILDVDRDATHEEIKQRYRALALQHHPDRNPDDPQAEERFKEISLAYAILGNAERRAEYDRGRTLPGIDLDLDLRLDIEDLLRRVFRRRRRKKAGEDLKYTLRVTFAQAALGDDVRIRIPRLLECGPCEGLGVIRSRICDKCEGEGRFERQDTLVVPVPAGVEDQKRLRLNGLGHEGVAGGRHGDLFVIVEIRPHPILERDGHDVVCSVPITVSEAALGTEVVVPTVEGTARVRIPPGTQPGAVFRLAGRGIAGAEGRGGRPQRGDQRVTVDVVVPTRLNDTEREAFERLREERPRLEEVVLADYQRALDSVDDEESALE